VNVNPVGSGAESAFGLQGMQRPHPPSFSNTASLLGLSSSDLGTQLQSGSTLADIARQKGVSSSDLVASV
jgi:hypothetical protein